MSRRDDHPRWRWGRAGRIECTRDDPRAECSVRKRSKNIPRPGRGATRHTRGSEAEKASQASSRNGRRARLRPRPSFFEARLAGFRGHREIKRPGRSKCVLPNHQNFIRAPMPARGGIASSSFKLRSSSRLVFVDERAARHFLRLRNFEKPQHGGRNIARGALNQMDAFALFVHQDCGD